MDSLNNVIHQITRTELKISIGFAHRFMKNINTIMNKTGSKKTRKKMVRKTVGGGPTGPGDYDSAEFDGKPDLRDNVRQRLRALEELPDLRLRVGQRLNEERLHALEELPDLRDRVNQRLDRERQQAWKSANGAFDSSIQNVVDNIIENTNQDFESIFVQTDTGQNKIDTNKCKIAVTNIFGRLCVLIRFFAETGMNLSRNTILLLKSTVIFLFTKLGQIIWILLKTKSGRRIVFLIIFILRLSGNLYATWLCDGLYMIIRFIAKYVGFDAYLHRNLVLLDSQIVVIREWITTGITSFGANILVSLFGSSAVKMAMADAVKEQLAIALSSQVKPAVFKALSDTVNGVVSNAVSGAVSNALLTHAGPAVSNAVSSALLTHAGPAVSNALLTHTGEIVSTVLANNAPRLLTVALTDVATGVLSTTTQTMFISGASTVADAIRTAAIANAGEISGQIADAMRTSAVANAGLIADTMRTTAVANAGVIADAMRTAAVANAGVIADAITTSVPVAVQGAMEVATQQTVVAVQNALVVHTANTAIEHAKNTFMTTAIKSIAGPVLNYLTGSEIPGEMLKITNSGGRKTRKNKKTY